MSNPNKPRYTKGLYFNLPNPKAPDFVKGTIAIKPQDFMDYLKDAPVTDKGYLYIDLKSFEDRKNGGEKGTSSISDYHHPREDAPNAPAAANNGSDDLPF